MEQTYNVLSIIRGTTVDGPGFRTSIYLAGCAHHCPGCHNPESWNPNGGTPMTADEILEVIKEEDFNVTLSGGDPLFNPEAAKSLIDKIKTLGKTVWLFTGYRWEDIMKSPELREAIMKTDVIVDGPFIEALRDTDLLFRGSSNQRLIDVQASLLSPLPVIWESDSSRV